MAPLQTKRSSKPDGGQGTYVETPFHLGPAKQLTGKQGQKQLAWDVVVHPETISSAMGSASILAAVVDSVGGPAACTMLPPPSVLGARARGRRRRSRRIRCCKSPPPAPWRIRAGAAG